MTGYRTLHPAAAPGDLSRRGGPVSHAGHPRIERRRAPAAGPVLSERAGLCCQKVKEMAYNPVNVLMLTSVVPDRPPSVGPTCRSVVVPQDDETPREAVSLPAPNDMPPETPVRSTARNVDRDGPLTGDGELKTPAWRRNAGESE